MPPPTGELHPEYPHQPLVVEEYFKGEEVRQVRGHADATRRGPIACQACITTGWLSEYPTAPSPPPASPQLDKLLASEEFGFEEEDAAAAQEAQAAATVDEYVRCMEEVSWRYHQGSAHGRLHPGPHWAPQHHQDLTTCTPRPSLPQLEAEGTPPAISPVYGAQLLPLLRAGGVVQHTTIATVVAWLSTNRWRPDVAAALLRCGWQHSWETAADRRREVYSLLGSALTAGAESPEKAQAALGLFRKATSAGNPEYLPYVGKETVAWLAQQAAMQPDGHPLRGLSNTQLDGSLRACRADERLAGPLSERAAALVAQHGDAALAGTSNPNQQAFQAHATALRDKAWTHRVVALDGIISSVSALPLAERATINNRPALLGDLPPAAAAAVGTVVRAGGFKSTALLYFANCMKDSRFVEGLHQGLSEAKQRAVAELPAEVAEALAVADALALAALPAPGVTEAVKEALFDFMEAEAGEARAWVFGVAPARMHAPVRHGHI